MDGMNSPEERELRSQVDEVREKLQGLSADLRGVDHEVERLAPQRAQHELLDQACGSLEKLGELGAATLFWGERIEPARVAERLRDVRERVRAFQALLGEFDERRRAILTEIGREEENLEILGADLYDAWEQEERRKAEWVVERVTSPLPRRVQVMAWARGGEDDRRFRKSLTASLAAGLLLGALLPMIDLPLPERFRPDAMPKRLVQLVRQEQAKLIPPPAVPQPQAEPKPIDERKPPEREAKPRSEKPAPGPVDVPPGPVVAEAHRALR